MPTIASNKLAKLITAESPTLVVIHHLAPVANNSSTDTDLSIENANWSSLFLYIFVIWGFCGNALVVLAILTERRLQNVTNYCLGSLAIADLCVSIAVMPFAILVEIDRGGWRHGFVLCLLWNSLDVFLCTLSILHMSFIAVDRYLGISQPFRLRQRSRSGSLAKISIIWVLAAGIASPITIIGFVEPLRLYRPGHCEIEFPHFQIFASILSFYIPFIVTCVAYRKTILLLRLQAKLCSWTKESTKGQRNLVLRRNKLTSTASTGLVSRNSSISSSLDSRNAGRLKRRGSLPNLRVKTPSPTQFRKPPTCRAATPKPRIVITDEDDGISINYCSNERNRSFGEKTPPSNILHDDSTLSPSLQYKPSHLRTKYLLAPATPQNAMLYVQEVNMAVCDALRKAENHRVGVGRTNYSFKSNLKRAVKIFYFRRRNSDSSMVLNEQKATKVLGLVFFSFFVCWFPFFTLNVTLAICQETCKSTFPPVFASALLWLGYLSSTINPLIYTIFNSKFRRAFIDLLTCKWFWKCHHFHRKQSNISQKSWNSYTHSGVKRDRRPKTTSIGEMQKFIG